MTDTIEPTELPRLPEIATPAAPAQRCVVARCWLWARPHTPGGRFCDVHRYGRAAQQYSEVNR